MNKLKSVLLPILLTGILFTSACDGCKKCNDSWKNECVNVTGPDGSVVALTADADGCITITDDCDNYQADQLPGGPCIAPVTSAQ